MRHQASPSPSVTLRYCTHHQAQGKETATHASPSFSRPLLRLTDAMSSMCRCPGWYTRCCLWGCCPWGPGCDTGLPPRGAGPVPPPVPLRPFRGGILENRFRVAVLDLQECAYADRAQIGNGAWSLIRRLVNSDLDCGVGRTLTQITRGASGARSRCVAPITIIACRHIARLRYLVHLPPEFQFAFQRLAASTALNAIMRPALGYISTIWVLQLDLLRFSTGCCAGAPTTRPNRGRAEPFPPSHP